MRNLHTIANCGALFDRSKNAFMGSSFIFRYPTVLLTAAHCVSEVRTGDIGVQLMTGDNIYAVEHVDIHPQADLAVLRIAGVNELSIGWPLYELFDDKGYGTEVMACGLPEDIRPKQTAPTARVFRGCIQRFTDWKSAFGFEYFAAELSFRCPSGLSGGPLVNAHHNGRLYGLVAEDIQTTSVLSSIEETRADGRHYRDTYQSFINYGIAVWLPAVSDWLDSVVPRVSQTEIARRAQIQHKLSLEDAVKKG